MDVNHKLFVHSFVSSPYMVSNCLLTVQLVVKAFYVFLLIPLYNFLDESADILVLDLNLFLGGYVGFE